MSLTVFSFASPLKHRRTGYHHIGTGLNDIRNVPFRDTAVNLNIRIKTLSRNKGSQSPDLIDRSPE